MAERRFTSSFAVGRNATDVANVRGHRSKRIEAVTVASDSSVATAAALTATFGLAAVGWVIAIRQMSGMDMGVATELGAFGSFAALWVSMMAAMMLPGAAPALLHRVRAGSQVGTVPLFVGAYLAVWAAVGVAAYAAYRPHGSAAAGAVVIAAGVYELTPLKQHFRRQCSESVGFAFGPYCVGSSIGLMLMLLALGVMSVTWMVVIAVVVLAQKLLPAKVAVDVPLALAIIGFGIWIVIAPTSVPALTLPM